MALFLRQCALTILIGLASALVARSEDWPTRNVSVVIPLPPGVASDTTARIVFEQVRRQFRESFVIQNRPGAGGIIGANVVAKSPPDGYTALVYGSLAAATALYSKLPFDTINDFAPAGRTCRDFRNSIKSFCSSSESASKAFRDARASPLCASTASLAVVNFP